ncbi:MAG: DUF47 family protein [Chloroflexi bacterium]|nr:DUF47 family protein [Chloroflexota bacterium]
MKLNLLRVIRDLGGASSRRFVELLSGHLDATLEGAVLAERAVRGGLSWEQARAEMVDIEHRGDGLRRELILELSSEIVTPLDREDLFRVSRSIDDVLDNLRDFVRECDLFAVEDALPTAPTLAAIRVAVLELRGAIGLMEDRPERMNGQALAAHKAANAIRRSYEVALTELFRGPLTMEALKVREVLRRLDVVGLRIGEAADALSDASVKRSAGGVAVRGPG